MTSSFCDKCGKFVLVIFCDDHNDYECANCNRVVSEDELHYTKEEDLTT